MPSVDVPVALLGYGTVGAAVHRLLEEQGEEIERATGHRLRVVRALVRDASKERGFAPADGISWIALGGWSLFYAFAASFPIMALAWLARRTPGTAAARIRG